MPDKVARSAPAAHLPNCPECGRAAGDRSLPGGKWPRRRVVPMAVAWLVLVGLLIGSLPWVQAWLGNPFATMSSSSPTWLNFELTEDSPTRAELEVVAAGGDPAEVIRWIDSELERTRYWQPQTDQLGFVMLPQHSRRFETWAWGWPVSSWSRELNRVFDNAPAGEGLVESVTDGMNGSAMRFPSSYWQWDVPGGASSFQVNIANAAFVVIMIAVLGRVSWMACAWCRVRLLIRHRRLMKRVFVAAAVCVAATCISFPLPPRVSFWSAGSLPQVQASEPIDGTSVVALAGRLVGAGTSSQLPSDRLSVAFDEGSNFAYESAMFWMLGVQWAGTDRNWFETEGGDPVGMMKDPDSTLVSWSDGWLNAQLPSKSSGGFFSFSVNVPIVVTVIAAIWLLSVAATRLWCRASRRRISRRVAAGCCGGCGYLLAINP